MSKGTILVVDDDPHITDFLAEHLLPRLGYETLAAQDGQMALEIVRKHQPDLMLLDLQLPYTSGLDVLRQLVNKGHNVPTIILTARGSEQVAVDAFRLGVQDYLIKPVKPDTLKAAITRAFTETRLRREKARLTAQLQQQVTRLTVLSRVGQSVTSTLELDGVLRRIVEASVYLTEAEEGFLALLDEQNDQLYIRAAKGTDQARDKTLRLQVSDPLVSQVAHTRRPLRVAETFEGQPLKLSTGFLVQALLYVPVLSKDRLLGVLAVDNRTDGQTFSKMDEVLLAALAGYAAVAIENARLYAETDEQLKEAQMFGEASRAILVENARLYKEAARRAAEATSYAKELEALRGQERQQRESLGRLRSTFLNAIGHELTTPITVMIQTVETLTDPRREALNQEQKEMVETLRQQALRLQRMVGTLVTFAGFAAKQDDIEFSLTPLDAVLDDALQLARFKVQRKEVELEDCRPEGLPNLMVDGKRLSEALVNILDNAIRLSPPRAPVILSGKVHPDQVEISVQDFGPGIPKEEQDHIWDAFVQINRSLERGLEGLGLGLAMARHIIEAHGGTVSVDSIPDHGSTFTITLPRKRKVTGILTSPFQE